MFSDNFILYSGKIIVELIYDVAYFPLWWYWRGFFNLLISLKNFLVDKQRSLALLVWLKNIFRPMYGQFDWQGMLVSFFMRLAQIIFRSLALLFWLIAAAGVALAWLILPLFAVYEIILQLI
ncbi:MAG: hypothetical protein Q7R92_03235 [bacterium]|nr:hypothetical protein [bacterium]